MDFSSLIYFGWLFIWHFVMGNFQNYETFSSFFFFYVKLEKQNYTEQRKFMNIYNIRDSCKSDEKLNALNIFTDRNWRWIRWL